MNRFVKLVLPRNFKQSKFGSFQRQLNVYGFKRLMKGYGHGSYYNPNFQQGRLDLLANMKRNVTSRAANLSSWASESSTSTAPLKDKVTGQAKRKNTKYYPSSSEDEYDDDALFPSLKKQKAAISFDYLMNADDDGDDDQSTVSLHSLTSSEPKHQSSPTCTSISHFSHSMLQDPIDIHIDPLALPHSEVLYMAMAETGDPIRIKINFSSSTAANGSGYIQGMPSGGVYDYPIQPPANQFSSRSDLSASLNHYSHQGTPYILNFDPVSDNAADLDLDYGLDLEYGATTTPTSAATATTATATATRAYGFSTSSPSSSVTLQQQQQQQLPQQQQQQKQSQQDPELRRRSGDLMKLILEGSNTVAKSTSKNSKAKNGKSQSTGLPSSTPTITAQAAASTLAAASAATTVTTVEEPSGVFNIDGEIEPIDHVMNDEDDDDRFFKSILDSLSES